jgi:hypothetical protein
MNQDFRDLFSEFNDADVRYLVVGAYAVIHYTEPRYTKDLDIWIEPSRRNAERARRALASFGAPVADLEIDDLCNPDLVFQIGIEPNRIDIIMGLGRLVFADAWGRAEQTTYGGIPIRILGIEDLVASKREADRPQDRFDIARLEATMNRSK